ncbi:MAG: hypothetical protein SO442_00700 [Prevotella sp.]|nr:hypothetical protein [Prevotella sp.]MDD7336569.1 hypothetical protein [Prevotella sp.]MDY4625104.1 hypothetical protein [Prevotella sp.]MDY5258537.1 hypothetical protein [Prevotella sp.]
MKKLTIIAAALLMPAVACTAQSSYENISDTAQVATSNTENLSIDSYYQQWLSQYEDVGQKINDISEQYQKEVDKRGYPKKKTVQQKITLVEQYIKLLQEELSDSRLNQNLDTKKVQDKITLWQDQLAALNNLLTKI